MNLRKWYHDNLRMGVHRVTLVPVHQIEPRGASWLSTGMDPQFLPMSSRGGVPKGWVIIELQADRPLQLRFYFDVGHLDGDSQKHVIVPVDVERAGFTRWLAEFPVNSQAVRLDPTDEPGAFSLHSISIRELGAIPLAGLCGVNAMRHSRGIRARLRALKMTATAMVKRDSAHIGALLRFTGGVQPATSASRWFENYRPDATALDALRARTWPENAPLFSVVMPVWNTPQKWLNEAIASVRSQTYAKWELICVDDASSSRHVQATLSEVARADGRIRPIRNPKNLGVSAATVAGIRAAKGDYVLFMDHDDVLEPQALHRFASAVLIDQADMLYGDEVLTAEDDLDKVLHVSARPQLSYDYYVNHPYFVHPIAVRRSLALKVGGLDESLSISQDVDFNLRVLEQASKVTHIPDILYRWRQVSTSSGHQKAGQVTQATIGILERHLARLGFDGQVSAGPIFNTYRTRFFDGRTLAKRKVAIIIPTKNREDLLRMCVESIEATVPRDEYDLIVVDHESDSPSAQEYFASISGRHTVLPYSGNFNFSKINNHAVRALGDQYAYYLFMNNDIEAVEKGWLEAMRDLATRSDIGIVGAMLLYPDRTIQHAGVIMGMHGAAEHAHKWVAFYDGNRRVPGYDQALVANRDFSAVTAACMLMRAEVFHKVGGYDEKLVVGFNDVDLCLRVGQAGYKIVNSAEAVLIHHESASRGKSTTDPHPEDSLLFTTRYRDMIAQGDPYFSPLLSDKEPRIALNPDVKWTPDISIRTSCDFLPRSKADTLDDSSAPVRV